jgi:hypothetical protein
MLVTSLFSNPPTAVKNLRPFAFQGMWEAVSMIVPSYPSVDERIALPNVVRSMILSSEFFFLLLHHFAMQVVDLFFHYQLLLL